MTAGIRRRLNMGARRPRSYLLAYAPPSLCTFLSCLTPVPQGATSTTPGRARLPASPPSSLSWSGEGLACVVGGGVSQYWW